MAGKDQVETALRRLQALMRTSTPDTQSVMTVTLPLELRSEDATALGLARAEVEAMATVGEVLEQDLRFEHLRHTDDLVRDFAVQAWAQPSINLVPAWMSEHAAEVESVICSLAVEYLVVEEPIEVAGVHIVPCGDDRVPPLDRWLYDRDHVGSVAQVDVEGSDGLRTVKRARARADHALRLLRVTMRDGSHAASSQLRFRLGTAFAFDANRPGWIAHADHAHDITLTAEMFAQFRDKRALQLAREPSTKLGKQANLAIRWIERSLLEPERITALLFLFFALEALLGDQAEGTKAPGLAFRQMQLRHILTGGFAHPDRTWFLYDKVRSTAVHGGEPPAVDDGVLANFARTVRESLDHWLTLADREGLTSRGSVIAYLGEHESGPELRRWLEKNAHPDWVALLATEPSPDVQNSTT